MNRLIDEIAPSCAVTAIRTQSINRLLMSCRGPIAISKISPLPSQRVLNLGRLMEVAPRVRTSYIQKKNTGAQQ
jgi:hypothetical protein